MQACRDVLQKVRTEAEARNAGIIFLGKESSHASSMTLSPRWLPPMKRISLVTCAVSWTASIFLAGDFWHARGTLPVVPLNIVLSELQNWRQPTLMLVGNHDQVEQALANAWIEN